MRVPVLPIGLSQCKPVGRAGDTAMRHATAEDGAVSGRLLHEFNNESER